ncbi:MAG: c-type cytochrome [Bacteroidota bacterium]
MRSRTFTYPSLLLLIFLLAAPISRGLFAKANEEEGGKLFKTHCSACHKMEGVLVGPALKGLNAKYAGDEAWLKSWIKNAPGLINNGDEKANALYNEWKERGGMMNSFAFLSDQNIDDILVWVAAETDRLENPPVVEVSTLPPGGQESIYDDPRFYYTMLALVGVLALIAVLLVGITAVLVSAIRAKEQQEPLTFADIMARTKSMLSNPYVATAIIAFALMGGTTKLVVEARTIGLHQGYMPEQPIKFSHKLHAGTHEIDCKYCHSGVTKSKSAWIPSTNVCMNCHKAIQEGPTYGEEEIGKILASYESDEPIEWVRIHNLPDHAYFNHAQHVVVGGLECQTCHGPIEEMEVVYQFNDLGMGWCINCHREEKVKVLGKETEYTVEDMGGLNCARCHY